MDRKLKRHQISEQFIFSWLPQKNTVRTLLAFLAFSCMIHLIGFTLFNVGYPAPQSPDLKDNRITILDPRNDDVISFLSRLSDRVVYLDPPSEESISRVKLSDHAIRFVPSFAETKPTLKKTSGNDADFKYPISNLSIRTELVNWKNSLLFSPNLMKRGVAPNSILDDYLSLVPNVPNLRVNLTVLSDGVPEVVNFADGITDENRRLLGKAIESYLRFNPDESRGEVPGWVILGGELN